ncbi:MAG: hypothetical protein ACE5JE_02255 [Thermoplasmata archaeon]
MRWKPLALAIVVVLASVGFFIALPQPGIAATSQGPNYAGAVGTNAWTSPSNALGAGETTCAGDNYGFPVVSGFWNTSGFTIPPNLQSTCHHPVRR